MTTEARSSRLFESDFWERLTHVHHNTPFFIYIPVVALVLGVAKFKLGVSWGWIFGEMALGIFNWSWFEYALHRFVFHYEPRSDWGRRFHYLFHGIHHDFPNEKDRLVMPLVPSLGISTAVFSIHYGLMGPLGLPLYAGFLAGYLYYEFVHYSVHHKKKAGLLWFDSQRRDHLTHHFKDAGNRFGVTSPLWDFVFGSYRVRP